MRVKGNCEMEKMMNCDYCVCALWTENVNGRAGLCKNSLVFNILYMRKGQNTRSNFTQELRKIDET